MSSNTIMSSTGGLNARRITLMVLIVLGAGAALAPLFFLKRMAGTEAGDASYRALTVYAQAQNGDDTLAGQAAELIPTFVQKDLAGGDQQYARTSPDGSTCWVVVVEAGRASQPREGTPEDCKSDTTP